MNKIILPLCVVLWCNASVFAQTGPESAGFRQEGTASWYGAEFEGRPTASGELFNPADFTAAHPDLPFGTVLTVTNLVNNKQVNVRVNDRGPFARGRIIDVSRAAAEKLDMLNTGTAQVAVETASRGAVPAVASASAQNSGVAASARALPAQNPPSNPSQAPVPVAESAAARPAQTNAPAPARPQAAPSAPAAAPQQAPAQAVIPRPAQPPVIPAQSAPSLPQAVRPALAAQPAGTGQGPSTTPQIRTPSPSYGYPVQDSAVQRPSTPPPMPAAQRPPVVNPSAGQNNSQAPVARTAPAQSPQPPAPAQRTAAQAGTPANRSVQPAAPAPSAAQIQPVPAPARPPASVDAQMPAQARANALPQQQTQSSPSSSLGPRVSYPRAEILGASIISGRSYRLQIGSFKVAKNAVEVFDRLTAAGLSPKWEPFEDYYRVVLTNVPAEDMQQVASKLGGAGFKEVIAREER